MHIIFVSSAVFLNLAELSSQRDTHLTLGYLLLLDQVNRPREPESEISTQHDSHHLIDGRDYCKIVDLVVFFLVEMLEGFVVTVQIVGLGIVPVISWYLSTVVTICMCIYT